MKLETLYLLILIWLTSHKSNRLLQDPLKYNFGTKYKVILGLNKVKMINTLVPSWLS